jgi:hypothetical protein
MPIHSTDFYRNGLNINITAGSDDKPTKSPEAF